MQKTLVQNPLPLGWLGFSPLVSHSFEFGTARSGPEDLNSGFVRCVEDVDAHFGALMQVIDAAEFSGKTVRFCGMAKLDGTRAEGEMFIEVNGQHSNLTDSASSKRSISSEWKPFALEVKVSRSAKTISFGGLLRTAGELCFNSLKFAVEESRVQEQCGEVDDEESCANMTHDALQAPANLDFAIAPNNLPAHWNFERRNAEDAFKTTVCGPDLSAERYLRLECVTPKRTYAAGAISQTVNAQGLLGRSVELAGVLKSEGVSEQAGLFLRVNGPTRVLQKMYESQLSGTTDWRLHKICVNVPSDAISISFGVFLEGKGEICVQQLAISDDILTNAELSSSVRGTEISRMPLNLALQ